LLRAAPGPDVEILMWSFLEEPPPVERFGSIALERGDGTSQQAYDLLWSPAALSEARP
jgi:hypothetical protein